MKAYEAISKLEPKEVLIDIERVPSGTHFSVLAVNDNEEGVLIGYLIANVATISEGLEAAKKHYHGNHPRLLHEEQNRTFAAIKYVPVEEFVCHAYYHQDCGHSLHRINAESASHAFELLLQRIRDRVSDEDEMSPRPASEQISSVVIEAKRPLLVGQHPDTPRLLYEVARYEAKRRVVTTWISKPVEVDPNVAWAEAFVMAQASCCSGHTDNMKAVVTGVTEFGITGTLVPV